MPEEVKINPRYLNYNKDEVEQLLNKVKAETVAQEEDVRSIVTNYSNLDDNGE